MSERKELDFPREEDAQKVKTPKLTLDSEDRELDFSFLGPSLEKNEIVLDDVEGTSAGTVDESMLTEDEKKQVEEFVKQIDIKNTKVLNSYGSGAQKNITTFSTTITGTIKTKDFGDIGATLKELTAAINSTMEPERKGILGLFQKGKQKVERLASNYKSAEGNIKLIEKNLQKHQQVLTKDVYTFDQMYNMNLDFYKELTMYIIAGKKALNNARATELVELKTRAELTKDQLDIQNYRDYEDACNRFEKRIYDLETTRLVSIQMAPQIRLLQNANQQVIDKLRSNIINTIPLWRSQMVLALGIEHTTCALEAQSAVDEMTNEMFRRNAETLKQGAIDAALASERGIVDIETLRKVNADIIASINEVARIHKEGAQKRDEAREELAKIEGEFKQALLDASNR